MVPGPADNRDAVWRSSSHAVEHVDESSENKWKSTRHRPSIFSDWYLGESGKEGWRSSKKPGVYANQPEWIPPFREYEGKVPKRFYSIVPGVATDRHSDAAGARKKVGAPTGKRKSQMYNQFATTFNRYDEAKKPLGGIKTSYRKSSDSFFPFTPLPPPTGKKHFSGNVNDTEGVASLLNPTEDPDYNSYLFT